MSEEDFDEARWAHAKALYMEFRSIKDIVKATGLPWHHVKKRAYGPRGALRPNADSWFYERLETNREEFQELGARNLWLAQQISQKVLFESYESLKVLAKRTNKKTGEKVPLKPHEIKSLTDSIATLDRILRLRQGLPTDIMEIQQTEVPDGETDTVYNPVLDVQKVAQALKLDPAMRKLIGGISEEGLVEASGGRQQPGGAPKVVHERNSQGRFTGRVIDVSSGSPVLESDGTLDENPGGVRAPEAGDPKGNADPDGRGDTQGTPPGAHGTVVSADPADHSADADGSPKSLPVQRSDVVSDRESGSFEPPFADEYE